MRWVWAWRTPRITRSCSYQGLLGPLPIYETHETNAFRPGPTYIHLSRSSCVVYAILILANRSALTCCAWCSRSPYGTWYDCCLEYVIDGAAAGGKEGPTNNAQKEKKKHRNTQLPPFSKMCSLVPGRREFRNPSCSLKQQQRQGGCSVCVVAG